MKNLRNTKAVTEIIGEIALLAIAVTSISIIYTQVLSMPGPTDIANVTIIGKIERGRPVFELQRGESLGLDTKIFLTLAGYEQREFSQRNISNQEWNIGELIVLPVEDITGIQVDATIVDTKTNSIVFRGVLQEGLIVTYKGGIWHLDEPIWRGIPNEVIDSSGHNNHGVAVGAAKIINGTLQPQNVKCNNSGYFNGFMDIVRVKTAWTLNITKQITVEGWMKPDVPQFIADIVGVSGSFGYYPYAIPVVGDIYALVSEDTRQDCKLSTIKIDTEGIVTDCQNLTAGTSKAHNVLQPKIIQIRGGLVLVSYIDDNTYMHLKTFNISNNGSIEYTGGELIFSDYQSSINQPNFPSLQKITNNLCAIAYWSPSIGGILKTVNVSSNGHITCIETKTYGPWYDPCLVHVNGPVYAVAYRSTLNQGILKTFTITSAGNITYMGQMVQFESGSAYEPCLVQVSGNVFVVAYRNNLNYGIVKTFTIFSNGSIAWTGNMNVFESTMKCYTPCIVHGEEDIFVIAYATAAPGSDVAKGYVLTVELREDGSMGLISPRRLFDFEACSFPTIIHLYEHLFAISYTGHSKHPGKLITMLIGSHARGICKGESYMLYANMTMVEGRINDVLVSYHNNSIGSCWHHFALTYDGISICLYMNGTKVNETSYPYHRIDLTRSPLYFGRFYCGYIDEIAIYDKPLTQEQIFLHFSNPGTF